jgi:adenylylsulfate kinase-like enzyme
MTTPEVQTATTPNGRSGGAVIWITGLSGAGKSSVAAELVPRLQAIGP